MPEITNIQGLEQVQRKIRAISDKSARKRVLSVGGFVAQGILAQYPPSTVANSPANPSGRWYERGFGTRTPTGRSYRTSETLGRRWTMRATADEAVVGNNASYAPFVQGEKQAAFHKRRGWLSTVEVATKSEHASKIASAMERQIEKEIAAA